MAIVEYRALATRAVRSGEQWLVMLAAEGGKTARIVFSAAQYESFVRGMTEAKDGSEETR